MSCIFSMPKKQENGIRLLEPMRDSLRALLGVPCFVRRSRAEESPAAQEKEKRVDYPDLSINLTNYSVLYQGKPLEMPPKELELLYFLASNPNRVFTREQLLDQIWGYEYYGDTRTVDVHIKRIREKISDHTHWRIATIWSVGYKFEVME